MSGAEVGDAIEIAKLPNAGEPGKPDGRDSYKICDCSWEGGYNINKLPLNLGIFCFMFIFIFIYIMLNIGK